MMKLVKSAARMEQDNEKYAGPNTGMCRDRVVSIPASYLCGRGFNSRLGDQVS
jgi:hypothetical protein